MKNKSLFLTTIFSLLVALFSCKNFTETTIIEKETPAETTSETVQTGNTNTQPAANKLTVQVEADFNNTRAAIPTALPSVVYFGKLTGIDSYIKSIGTGSNLKFIFDAYTADTEVTLEVYACSSGTTELTNDNLNSVVIAYGKSSAVTVGAKQLSADFGTINLTHYSAGTALGTVNLNFESTLDLGYGITYNGENVSSNFSLSTNGGQYSLELKTGVTGIPAGVYILTLSNNTVELENPVQIINVAAGMTTDKWLVNGALLDTLIINKASYSTFYVCGSDPQFYGTDKTSGLNVTPINSNSGSLMNPLSTVAAAALKCTDTTKEYTIYVDGTTTEGVGITINANTTIKALGTGAIMNRRGTSTGSMITVSSNKSLTMERITVDGNSNPISYDGAGIYNSGTLTLINTVIKNCETNRIGNYYGGAIYSASSSNIYLYGTTELTGNKATYGGAISAGDDSVNANPVNIVIGKDANDTNVKIWKNTAYEIGGAIMAKAKVSITMNAGSIQENTAAGSSTKPSKGGALYIWGNSIGCATFTMNGGSIHSNTSSSEKDGSGGGAVYIDDADRCRASFTMTGGIIYGNKATSTKGKAICHAAGTSDSGQLSISGNALIKEDNDIYLGASKLVTIAGTLTPTVTGDASGEPQTYTAYITPANYVDNTQVLGEATSGLIALNNSKFRLTNTDWILNSNGALFQDQIISLESAPTSGTYSLFKYESLEKIADWVKAGSTFVNVTIELAGNISISASDFMIGYFESSSDNKIFSGTFDGKGNTITLDINEPTATYYSLFGYLNGTVKNLNVNGSIKKNNSQSIYLGGIVSYIKNNASIINCVSNVDIEAKYSESESCGVGGIVGYIESNGANNVLIRDCINYGNITAPSVRSVAGIAGIGSYTHFINCLNFGNITGSCAVAGISGHSSNSLIENCGNCGNITANWKSTSFSSTSGAGGIAAGPNASNSGWEPTIKNCYSLGTVKVETERTEVSDFAGAIFGNYRIEDPEDRCYIYNSYYLQDSCSRVIGGMTTTSTQSQNASVFTGLKGAYSVGGTSLIDKLNTNVNGDMKRWKYNSEGYPVFVE